MSLIQEISEALQKGKSKNVKTLVQKALDEEMTQRKYWREDFWTA